MKAEDRATVDKLEGVWICVEELCTSLDDSDWDLPTDCPGWTVKDQLSHLIGTESLLLGRPAPDHEIPDMAHVRNPIGKTNEIQVDFRRSKSGAEVLEEFREVTKARIEQLRAYSDEDFDKDSWTPAGPGSVRDFLQIRIFDCWVHEQDIRRAVGRPGHLAGDVADHGYERCAQAMPYVVGKKVGPPDGVTVLLEIEGTPKRTLSIGIQDGRARVLDKAASAPTARLAMDLETFVCLGCGRWSAEKAISDGKVTILGDESLASRLLAEMAFMV